VSGNIPPDLVPLSLSVFSQSSNQRHTSRTLKSAKPNLPPSTAAATAHPPTNTSGSKFRAASESPRGSAPPPLSPCPPVLRLGFRPRIAIAGVPEEEVGSARHRSTPGVSVPASFLRLGFSFGFGSFSWEGPAASGVWIDRSGLSLRNAELVRRRLLGFCGRISRGSAEGCLKREPRVVLRLLRPQFGVSSAAMPRDLVSV
jgi:hypothetical protein